MTERGCSKIIFAAAPQRVDKPIDTLQTGKKEGIFCQNESQTVRGYGKCSFWQKASNRQGNLFISLTVFLLFYI